MGLENDIDTNRDQLLDTLDAALRAVNGRTVVAKALRSHESAVTTDVIAVGKAASAMMLGALDVLKERFGLGLLITKTGHSDPALLNHDKIQIIESGHPVPDQCSLEAGETLLRFIASVPAEHHVLFLLSGGASSLVEVTKRDVVLADLQCANQWLLGSGLDIQAVNTVRKALSRIKGGRLAQYLDGRATLALSISDVPGDRLADIGSGMLAPDDTRQAVENLPLPDWLRRLIADRAPMPSATAGCFKTIEQRIVATWKTACQAAADYGAAQGLTVHAHPELITGDAVDAGRRLARCVRDGAPGLHVWGGETTVMLPPDPGRGGRNQSLALAAAEAIAGRPDCFFLSVGSDGTDGPGDDAGALVDGHTRQRGEMAGEDLSVALNAADAGTFLAASGDLIQTGPTGTNVMDIMLGLKTR
jgi:hydroxypyruvate reductase